MSSFSIRFIFVLPIFVLASLSAVQGFTAAPSTRQPATRNQIPPPITIKDGHRIQQSPTALPVFAIGNEQVEQRPSLNFFLRDVQSIPFGISMHVFNSIVGVARLESFASDIQSSIMDAASYPDIHEATLLLMAFGTMGSIYDNSLNAVTRYVNQPSTNNNDFLLQLHKLRFVWHVVSMPLLAIPVTELAARASLIDESTSLAVSGILGALALLEGHKMITKFDVDTDLKLVDNRENSESNQSTTYLPGVMSYTTTRPMELVLPAILLVLYETIMGGAMVMQSGASSLSSWDFLTTSAPLLLACGTSTLGASAMVRTKPAIQLLSEHTHMSLLWAAYLATTQHAGVCSFLSC